MEEVVTLDLTYTEVFELLESGTVKPGSSIDVKLRAAREAFERDPKVYGNGLGLKFRETSESDRIKDQEDIDNGTIPRRTIKLSKENNETV